MIILTVLNLIYINASSQVKHYALDKMLAKGQLDVNQGIRPFLLVKTVKRGSPSLVMSG